MTIAEAVSSVQVLEVRNIKYRVIRVFYTLVLSW